MGDGTPLGKVRGLGSAREGTHHWIVQRMTAVGNLLLGAWLFASLILLPSLDHWAVTGWLAQPFVAVQMILFLVSVFAHLRLGLQVLVEDYVHDEGLKFVSLMLVNFYAIAGAVFGIFCVARISLGGAL
ncbi:MAG: succinate dehydrogenase, hydrophobic membrane anchor protein [Sphingobium sp.]|nr:succinate dehydrogenase, hydrophobic membrane anchor protein [Sphingobium sp.]